MCAIQPLHTWTFRTVCSNPDHNIILQLCYSCTILTAIPSLQYFIAVPCSSMVLLIINTFYLCIRLFFFHTSILGTGASDLGIGVMVTFYTRGAAVIGSSLVVHWCIGGVIYGKSTLSQKGTMQLKMNTIFTYIYSPFWLLTHQLWRYSSVKYFIFIYPSPKNKLKRGIIVCWLSHSAQLLITTVMCTRVSLASIHSHGIKERALVRRPCFVQNVVITSLTWSVLVTMLPLLGTCIDVPLKHTDEMIHWPILHIINSWNVVHVKSWWHARHISANKLKCSTVLACLVPQWICHIGCAKYWFSWSHLSYGVC